MLNGTVAELILFKYFFTMASTSCFYLLSSENAIVIYGSSCFAIFLLIVISNGEKWNEIRGKAVLLK